MGYGIKVGATVCFPYVSKKKNKGLKPIHKKYNKRFIKENVYDKAIKRLIHHFNIDTLTAESMYNYALKKSMLNANGKVTGGRMEHFRKIDNNINYMKLPDEYIRRIDDMTEKVKHVRSEKQRQQLLLSEMVAYMGYRYKRNFTSITDTLLDIENKWVTKPVGKVFSKWYFWLATSVLVFDVLDGQAKDMTADIKIENDTIKYNYENFYMKRAYMSEKERFAWSVYDNVIEEIGRELIAAGTNEIVLRTASKGSKWLANIVITLALNHPSLRALRTVGAIAKGIAEIIDKSFTLRLVSQPFIEWRLEGWLAMHEWRYLKRFRDWLAGYKEDEKISKKIVPEVAKEMLANAEFLRVARRWNGGFFHVEDVDASVRKKVSDKFSRIYEFYDKAFTDKDFDSYEVTVEKNGKRWDDDYYYVRRTRKEKWISGCGDSERIRYTSHGIYESVSFYHGTKLFHRRVQIADIVDDLTDCKIYTVTLRKRRITYNKNAVDFYMSGANLLDVSQEFSFVTAGDSERVFSNSIIKSIKTSHRQTECYNFIHTEIVLEKRPLVLKLPKLILKVIGENNNKSMLALQSSERCIRIAKEKINKLVEQQYVVTKKQYTSYFLGMPFIHLDEESYMIDIDEVCPVHQNRRYLLIRFDGASFRKQAELSNISYVDCECGGVGIVEDVTVTILKPEEIIEKVIIPFPVIVKEGSKRAKVICNV